MWRITTPTAWGDENSTQTRRDIAPRAISAILRLVVVVAIGAGVASSTSTRSWTHVGYLGLHVGQIHREQLLSDAELATAAVAYVGETLLYDAQRMAPPPTDVEWSRVLVVDLRLGGGGGGGHYDDATLAIVAKKAAILGALRKRLANVPTMGTAQEGGGTRSEIPVVRFSVSIRSSSIEKRKTGVTPTLFTQLCASYNMSVCL